MGNNGAFFPFGMIFIPCTDIVYRLRLFIRAEGLGHFPTSKISIAGIAGNRDFLRKGYPLPMLAIFLIP